MKNLIFPRRQRQRKHFGKSQVIHDITTMKNDVKCTHGKENGCAYGHIFLALKTSMSISSESEKIFDII
jgi:hypothetical protein